MLAAARASSREIGARLDLSVRTVDNHLGRVYAKLGVSSRSQLAALLRARTPR
jgi:DNA-binding CsgD family transcriptional regulator